jgi:hypothetical protein
MYQVNKGINIEYAETLIKDFLAEGYNLYDISEIMHLPVRQILDILIRKINFKYNFILQTGRSIKNKHIEELNVNRNFLFSNL